MGVAGHAAALTFSPPISVTYEWSDNDNILTLTPITGTFAPNTHYMVGLQPTATSVDGDFVLGQPHHTGISISNLTPLGGFGYGPNLQVLLADGRRELPYQALRVERTHEFELYTLTPSQFITSYATGFGTLGDTPLPVIDVAGAEQVAAWQEVDEFALNNYVSNYEGASTRYTTTLPAAVPPGLYLLNMNIGPTHSQLFVVLTHHTMVIKHGVDEVVAWLTNSDGVPAVGAAATLYGQDVSPLATATSDEEGLLEIPLRQEEAPLLLMAEVDGEMTIAGFDAAWASRASAWRWGWPAPARAPRYDYAVHLYTDRPIYRPGQTLYYKAILRADDDAQLTLPDQELAVRVRLRDARNNIVRTITSTPNAFGTVEGKFLLAEGAMVGDYRLELEVEGETHSATFQVQEYRKPDFTVEVTTDAPAYIRANTSDGASDEDVTIEVNSRFLWGEPVANASVRWQRFYVMPGEWGDSLSKTVLMGGSEEAIFTDAEGYARLSMPAHHFQNQGYQEEGTWGVEVTVEDEGGQSVSASTLVNFIESKEQIQLSAPNIRLVNQPFTLGITVTNVAGEPVAGKALQVITQREHLPTMTSGAEGMTIVTTTVDGRAQVEYNLTETGYYHLSVTEPTITNADGTEEANVSGLNVIVGADVIVIDPLDLSDDPNAYYYPFVVTLDRASYLPGEVAEITVLSRFGGPALVTMERGKVRRTQLVELTPPMTIVTTTIMAEDAPNLFVTVNGWEATAAVASSESHQGAALEAPDLSHPDAFLHNSSVELRIPLPEKQLLVMLTADQEQYAPRQEATFTVSVTDNEGKPVDAELSLALVDEAIFSLAGDQSRPIYDDFYYPRAHAVQSFDTMAPTRLVDICRCGGGGGMELRQLPRHDFRDTVAWLPSVATGEDGVAEVTMTLPDNLTTWRLTVKAITAESTQVGEAATTITTWQPLVVRPLLPRGVTAGDEATLSATLHNESDEEQQATIWLEAASPLLQVGATPTQTVTLAPGEVRVVGWPVTATAAGSVTVTIAALASGSSDDALEDAVESALLINPLATTERTTQVGQFEELWETTINVPEGVLPVSKLRIELNRSVAGSFVSGLEYLTGFPYGCVEQTMSRALPNAVVSRAFHRLGIDSSLLHPDLVGLVDASVQRLYGFQHADGGWGWWYDEMKAD